MKDYFAVFTRNEKDTLLRILNEAAYRGSKIAENISMQLQGGPNRGVDWEIRMNRPENDYLWLLVSNAQQQTDAEFAILGNVLLQLTPPREQHEPLQAGEDRQ